MRDHVDALRGSSRFDVKVLSNHYPRIRELYTAARAFPEGMDLSRFDVVVIHYTCEFSSPNSLDQQSWDALKHFRGLKVLFLQDEYQFVDRTVARIAEAGIDVLFTCVPESEWDKVYPSSRLPGLRRVQTLTGFVPRYLLGLKVPAIARRPIDVGYRARVLPYWLGELGAEKWQIGERFLAATSNSGLRTDISAAEGDRLYGSAWTDFLASCKAILGVESGASVFDFSGELKQAVNEFVAGNPGVGFEEVQQRFLLPHEHRIRLNQISPRCFEAAALRTGMILYEGEYSGVLAPERHYLPLRKDFSNVEQIVAALKDPHHMAQVVDAAYEEIARNPAHSFETFVGKFDDVIEEEVAARQTRPATFGRIHGMSLIAPAESVISTLLDLWLRLPQGLRRFIKWVLAPFYRAGRE